MKKIYQHTSWSQKEVIAILVRKNSFTMCRLPHYRYRPVQDICSRLLRAGLIRKTGQDDTGINYVPTSWLLEWFDEWVMGNTPYGPFRWVDENKLGLDLV